MKQCQIFFELKRVEKDSPEFGDVHTDMQANFILETEDEEMAVTFFEQMSRRLCRDAAIYAREFRTPDDAEPRGFHGC